MQARRLSEIVKELSPKVHELAQTSLEFQCTPEKKMIMILLYAESRVSFSRLLKLLKDYENSDTEATQESLKPFCDFLLDRWESFQQTDASYTISPQLPINEACCALASLLAPVYGKHKYDLLMPTIPFNKYKLEPHGSLYDFKLHQFILGTDGTPLSVELCYQYLEYLNENRRKSLPSATLKPAVEPPMPSLGMADEQLVSKHSAAAERYYNAIKLNEGIAESKQAFLLEMAKERCNVLSSYGEVGKQRLMKMFLKKHITRTVIGLTNFLCLNVRKENWGDFLAGMERNDLFQYVLGIDLLTLKSEFGESDVFKKKWLEQTEANLIVLSNSTFSFTHEDHLRALMLCFLETYRIARTEGPEFKSNFGQYFGAMISMAYPKEVKLGACAVLRDVVLNQPFETLCDIPGYLHRQNLADKYLGPLTTCSTMSSNVLTSITRLIETHAKQFIERNKKPQPKPYAYGKF